MFEIRTDAAEVSAFLEAEAVPGGLVGAFELLEAFGVWRVRTYGGRSSISANLFGRILRRLGLPVRKSSRMYYVGLSLRPDMLPAPPTRACEPRRV